MCGEIERFWEKIRRGGKLWSEYTEGKKSIFNLKREKTQIHKFHEVCVCALDVSGQTWGSGSEYDWDTLYRIF